MEENTPFIELKKVSKYYSNANNVSMGLHQISIKMNINEIIAITGQSGSGKSTFLNVVSKVDSYEEGELYFNGKATSYFSQEDDESFRRNNVGFIFQNYNLVDSYTVKQNVMLPLLIQGKTVEEASSEALKIIERVGLKDRENHRGTKLSGGEKQRCVIARALASDSKILACDEPTGNLDSKTSKEIIDLLYEVSKDRLVLIVTHNFDEVADIATRNIEFSDGEIIRDTKLKDVEESDLPVETDSKDNKLLKRNIFFFGLKNLVSTPKKTIFSFIVLLFSCVFVILISGLFLQYVSIENSFKYNNIQNPNPDRIEISKYDGSSLDINELKDKLGLNEDDITLNSSYEEKPIFDIKLSQETSDDYTDYFSDSNIGYISDISIGTHMPKYIDKVYGSTKLGQGDLFLYIPKSNLPYVKDLIGEKITLSIKNLPDVQYILKGIGINQYNNSNIIYDSDNSLYSRYLVNYLYSNLSIKYFEKGKIDSVYDIDPYDVLLDDSITKGTVYVVCPEVMREQIKSKTILAQQKFCLNNNKDNYMYGVAVDTDCRYAAVTDFNVEYEFTRNLFQPEIQLSPETYLEILNQSATTASISKLSKSQTQKLLNSKEYNVTDVNDISDYDNTYNDPLYSFLSEATIFIVCVIAVVIIYFITYFILGKIYKSKNKDYTIMRTLGVSKKQMSHIVYLELFYTSIIVIIISILFSRTMSNIFRAGAFSEIRKMNSTYFILLFAFFCIFTLKIGMRFNKKLFSNTVNMNLKKEELKND